MRSFLGALRPCLKRLKGHFAERVPDLLLELLVRQRPQALRPAVLAIVAWHIAINALCARSDGTGGECHRHPPGPVGLPVAALLLLAVATLRLGRWLLRLAILHLDAAARRHERRLLAVVNGVKAVLPARGRWRAEPVDVLPLNVGQREGWRLLGDGIDARRHLADRPRRRLHRRAARARHREAIATTAAAAAAPATTATALAAAAAATAALAAPTPAAAAPSARRSSARRWSRSG